MEQIYYGSIYPKPVLIFPGFLEGLVKEKSKKTETGN